ncbi:MAG: hypothetical protein M3O09_17350 [Acidobacteriota bacterium]|nr:hypothetical protein [Acidobacteriota bacterium]
MKSAPLFLALCIITSNVAAQRHQFRWVTARTDSAIYEQIRAEFALELAPDSYDAKSNVVREFVKTIERIGLRGNTLLVVIGEKEDKTDPYTVFRAFSFDLRTKTKLPVRSKGVEWLWMWRFEKVAHFTSADDTDVTFQFFDCTECEAERLLGSFNYVPSTGSWEVRQWSKEDGAALVIGSDVQYGDDGPLWYDCLHAVSDITGDGLDDVAVRCRESLQPDAEKGFKRVTSDTTVLYTAVGGRLTRAVVGKNSALSSRFTELYARRSRPVRYAVKLVDSD